MTYTDYTETWTGFSSAPSGGIARYAISGKFCHVIITRSGLNGTSNATTVTVTLPFAASSSGVQISLCSLAVDGGVTQTLPARIDTRVGSTIADVYKTATVVAWTASGAKNVFINFCYEMA